MTKSWYNPEGLPEGIPIPELEVEGVQGAPVYRFGAPPRAEKCHTCAIIGSGPSVAHADFKRLDDPGVFTVDLNHEIDRNLGLYIPDVWFFGDTAIPEMYKKDPNDRDLRTVVSPATVVITSQSVARYFMCHAWFKNVMQAQEARWEHSELFLHWTVATAATHWAAEVGFKRIVLLGVDCHGGYHSDAGGGIRANTVGEKDKYQKMQEDWLHLRRLLEKRHPKVRVLNASLGTALRVFERTESW